MVEIGRIASPSATVLEKIPSLEDRDSFTEYDDTESSVDQVGRDPTPLAIHIGGVSILRVH